MFTGAAGLAASWDLALCIAQLFACAAVGKHPVGQEYSTRVGFARKIKHHP